MTAAGTRPSILYLAPALLERRLYDPIRGVQIFDLHNIAGLCRLGHRITLPAESTWRDRLTKWFHAQSGIDDRLEFIWTPSLRKPMQNSIAALVSLCLKRARFDSLVIGNVSKGLAPAIDLIRTLKFAPHAVVIAHKGLNAGAAPALRRFKADIVAVNQRIADEFADWPTSTGVPSTPRYGVPHTK
ncbi:MAG: hypothetical protein AAGB34_05675, partial [Planctomycetota bacterium]